MISWNSIASNKLLDVDPLTGRGEVIGRLLDVEPDTWLIKAPDLFSFEEISPQYIEVGFGHANYFWRAPVEVKASFRPWLFIKPPHHEDARRIQRRTFVRVVLSANSLAVPLTPTGKQKARSFEVSIENLSAGGCLVHAEKELGKPGDYVLMVLNLPGMDRVGAPGRVVRVNKNRYGIHFHGLKGKPQDNIARFISDQIIQHLRNGRDITLPQPETGNDIS